MRAHDGFALLRAVHLGDDDALLAVRTAHSATALPCRLMSPVEGPKMGEIEVELEPGFACKILRCLSDTNDRGVVGKEIAEGGQLGEVRLADGHLVRPKFGGRLEETV